MSENKLWERDTFLNKNIFYLFNKVITEYDMSDAGFSLIQEFKLLDEKTIRKLKEFSKDDRKKKIGIIQRDNDKLKEDLKNGFAVARKMFFKYNDLKDEDIITIKKDAIITTELCRCTKIGEYINFRPKHTYSSYILLKPTYNAPSGKELEIYYSPYDFAVKGIGDNKLELHEDYMIKFLKMYFMKMETADNKTVIEFTRRFIDRYKRKELDMGYYRNFSTMSNYTLIDDDLENIDISYNLFNVLLKLIKIPL